MDRNRYIASLHRPSKISSERCLRPRSGDWSASVPLALKLPRLVRRGGSRLRLTASGKAKRVIVEVKSGHVRSEHIRSLAGVVERENAAIGVFITLEPPSRDMTSEAVGKGFYHSEGWNKDYPKLQILTIEELLDGKQPNMPPTSITFKQAERMGTENKDQDKLGFE